MENALAVLVASGYVISLHGFPGRKYPSQNRPIDTQQMAINNIKLRVIVTERRKNHLQGMSKLIIKFAIFTTVVASLGIVCPQKST